MSSDLRIEPDRLVGRIYAALLGEAGWDDFLSEMVSGLPDGRGMLFFYDEHLKKGHANLSTGFDIGDQRRFSNYYSTINPWMPRAVSRRVGHATVSELMCPWRELQRTEFYNDYLRSLNANGAVGLTVFRDQGSHLFITGVTSQSDPNSNQPHADLFSAVAPHLKRAFDYYRANLVRDAIGAVGASLLSSVDVGVIVAGEQCRTSVVSPAAERLIETNGAVRIRRHRLSFGDYAASAMLRHMCSRGWTGPTTYAFMAEAMRVTLVSIQKDPGTAFFQGPTVIVTLEPLKRKNAPIDPKILSETYGLTASEARAVQGILAGLSNAEIASNSRVSVETVRSQAKSAYSRLNVSGRLELIATLRTSALRPTE